MQVITSVPSEQSGQPHVRLTVEHGKTYDLLHGKKVENAGAMSQCIYSAPRLDGTA
jgi:4-hydroxy-L-threonine phosphate dehydrogenase PdxA